MDMTQPMVGIIMALVFIVFAVAMVYIEHQTR